MYKIFKWDLRPFTSTVPELKTDYFNHSHSKIT